MSIIPRRARKAPLPLVTRKARTLRGCEDGGGCVEKGDLLFLPPFTEEKRRARDTHRYLLGLGPLKGSVVLVSPLASQHSSPRSPPPDPIPQSRLPSLVTCRGMGGARENRLRGGASLGPRPASRDANGHDTHSLSLSPPPPGAQEGGRRVQSLFLQVTLTRRPHHVPWAGLSARSG